MSIADPLNAWNAFFFEPQPTAPLALFRVAFGALQVVNAVLLLPSLPRLFGPRAIVPLDTIKLAYGKHRFSLFLMLPDNNRTLYALWAALLTAAVCVCVGFATRLATIALFALLVSFHHRNPCVANSGDTLSRLMAFLMIFAPTADTLSVDAMLWPPNGRPADDTTPTAAPWALRLMQLQVGIVYLRTVFWKLRGSMWRDGTAAYYPTQLVEYRRLAAPDWLLSPGFVAAATWGTLVVEAAMGSLVWVRELRYPILIATASMHLGLELLLNVGLFGWLMIATMLLFIFPADAVWLINGLGGAV